jgi:acetyltransferase
VERDAVKAVIAKAHQAKRTLLTEHESKQILAAYGIPTIPSRLAATEEEAVEAANSFGFPVVLKLHSETITHKTDVGGVQLDLGSDAQVRDAFRLIESSVQEKAGPGHFLGVSVQPMVKRKGYELIVGCSPDPQFGPVLLFGMGGQLVEVFRDRSLALPPLNTTLARRMMESTQIYKALQGVRGRKPVDLAALEELLVQFSRLVVEQRWIKEIDINPLLASEDGLTALDARVVLYDPATPEDQLPKLAVRPYPVQYEGQWTDKSGTAITIRPIRPEDEPLMVRFHEQLSERTVYFRYLQMLNLNQRVAHERLIRICFIDYDREIALIAERTMDGQRPEILAVARLKRFRSASDAEFAIVVRDDFQGKGIGKELLRRLLDVARQEGVRRVVAEIHVENTVMQRVCEKLGFKLQRSMGDPTVSAEITLS